MQTRVSVPHLAISSTVRSWATFAFTIGLPLSAVRAQDTAVTTRARAPEHLLQWMIGGGFAKTSSSPLNQNTHGYNLQTGLAIRTPLDPLRFRLDGLFSDAGNARVQALTLNAVLAAPTKWKASPYLMAGGGGYMENGARMTSGWNLGIGMNVRVGEQIMFMESRVHSYRDAFAGQPYRVPFGVVSGTREPDRYLWHPLTFGFRF